jgi:deoxycytidine triphosphate deaminase
MILCDESIDRLCQKGLVSPYDSSLLNPASLDIRVGKVLLLEDIKHKNHIDFKTKLKSRSSVSYLRRIDLTHSGSTGQPFNEQNPYYIKPGTFLLAETLEKIKVPDRYCVHMYLKSSIARMGWNHSLAFWFDPGWDGIGTLEIRNITQYNVLPIWYGMRFGQLVVQVLDDVPNKLYNGKYQHAKGVENSK